MSLAGEPARGRFHSLKMGFYATIAIITLILFVAAVIGGNYARSSSTTLHLEGLVFTALDEDGVPGSPASSLTLVDGQVIDSTSFEKNAMLIVVSEKQVRWLPGPPYRIRIHHYRQN